MDMERYQNEVGEWVRECFGDDIASDQTERFFRFLEEALELAQAQGATKDEALALVNYVFGRPIGDPEQEVGGVMVTLAALTEASGIDLNSAALRELSRINHPQVRDRIRAKQAAKDRSIRTALPGDPEGTP